MKLFRFQKCAQYFPLNQDDIEKYDDITVRVLSVKKHEHFIVRTVSIEISFSLLLKGRVQCFSMQVVMNKYFLLNPDKNFGADPFCRFREKR